MKNKTKTLLSLLMVITVIFSFNIIAFAEEPSIGQLKTATSFRRTILDTSFEGYCSYFGLHATSNSSSLVGADIIVTGYPTDKLPSSNDENRTMRRCTGEIGSSITTYLIEHTADTESGESGAPIYYYDSTYGYQVVGIHIWGGVESNVGRRITTTLVELLETEGYI